MRAGTATTVAHRQDLLDVVDAPSPARHALRLVLAFVVLSRLVQDLYTLPIGISLHITDLVLAVLVVVWILWMMAEPLPFPMGLAGGLGAALMVLVWVAPFVNAGNMTTFELNGAERGLVRGTLMAGLFLATYHLANWRPWAYRMLKVTLVMTMFQAVIGIYEAVTKSRFQLLSTIWKLVGFEVDPRDIRVEELELEARLSGELRAYSTAPHSLVFAGLLVIGIGLCTIRFLESDSPKERRRYIFAILLQMIGLGATNQRTGFVALIALVLLLGVTQATRIHRTLPLAFGGLLGALAIVLVSPGTPRLLLNFFTGEIQDHNVAVRTARYSIVPQLLERNPFIGPGFRTGDPSVIIFDNAYLTELIELGVIGLGLLLAFLIVVAMRPFSVYKIAPPEDQPLIVAAMCASVTLFVTMATFDVLSFGQLFPTCLMLMAIGLARTDALRREQRSGRAGPARPRSRRSPSSDRRPGTV